MGWVKKATEMCIYLSPHPCGEGSATTHWRTRRLRISKVQIQEHVDYQKQSKLTTVDYGYVHVILIELYQYLA